MPSLNDPDIDPAAADTEPDDEALEEYDPTMDPMHPRCDAQVLRGYLDGFVRESLFSRDRYMPAEVLNQSLRLYLGDQADNLYPGDALEVLIINKIQNALMAIVAAQTEIRPYVHLKPRESGDPALAVFKPHVAAGLSELAATGMDPLAAAGIQLSPEQLAGEAPIDEETYKDLLAIERTMTVDPAAQAPGAQGVAPAAGGSTPGPAAPPPPVSVPVLDPATGQAMPLLTEDDFFLVDDEVVADFENTLWRVKWDEARGQSLLMENIFNTNLIGLQHMLVQFDPRYQQFDLENVQERRVYPDPTRSDFNQQGWIVYDDVISAYAAMARYPHLKPQILAAKERGGIEPITEFGDDYWGETDGYAYERDMVCVRTAWLRWCEYPATEEEALGCGWVKKRPPEELAAELEAAAAAGGEAGALPYFIPSEADEHTGKPTGPGADNWPRTNRAIRQVQYVADTSLNDVRCPYANIPLVPNRCKPIPYKPWGLGIPNVLEPIQRAINLLASSFLNHTRYYQSPMEVISQSMNELMMAGGDDAADLGAFPGRRIVAPDDLLIQLGEKLGFFIDPPPLPPSLTEWWKFLIELFDEIAGNPDVLQGYSQGGADSGRAIEALQSAAKGVFAYMSMATEDMLREVVQIMLQTMRDMMTDHEAMRCCSKYPPAVLRLLRQRAKSVTHDVEVKIASGGMATERQEQAEARQDYKDGVIGKETLLETLRRNPKREMQRLDEDAERAAKAAAAAQPIQPAPLAPPAAA